MPRNQLPDTGNPLAASAAIFLAAAFCPNDFSGATTTGMVRTATQQTHTDRQAAGTTAAKDHRSYILSLGLTEHGGISRITDARCWK